MIHFYGFVFNIGWIVDLPRIGFVIDVQAITCVIDLL